MCLQILTIRLFLALHFLVNSRVSWCDRALKVFETSIDAGSNTDKKSGLMMEHR